MKSGRRSKRCLSLEKASRYLVSKSGNILLRLSLILFRRLGFTYAVVFRGVSVTKQAEIVEMRDIEKQYALVHARLRLLQQNLEPTQLVTSQAYNTPAQTVTQLVNAEMFDSAVSICQLFGLPLTSVFEGLANRCALLRAFETAVITGVWSISSLVVVISGT